MFGSKHQVKALEDSMVDSPETIGFSTTVQVFQPNGELLTLKGSTPTGLAPQEFKTVSLTKNDQIDALVFESRSYGIAVSEASEWAESWGAEVGDVLVEINGCVHDSADQANRTMDVAMLPITVRLLKAPADTGDCPFTENDPRAVSHVYLANQPKVVTSHGVEDPDRKIKDAYGKWVYPGKFNKHSDPFNRKKVLEASGKALNEFSLKSRYQPIDFKKMKYDHFGDTEVAHLVGSATEWRPMNAPHGKNVQVGPCMIQVVKIPMDVNGKKHSTHRIIVYSSNSQENGVKVREALVDGKLKEHIAGKWSTFADDVELPESEEQDESDDEDGQSRKKDEVAMRQFPSLTTETRYGLHENNALREFGLKTIALESHCRGVHYNERVSMSATVEQRQVQHTLGGEHRKVGDEGCCCDGCCQKTCDCLWYMAGLCGLCAYMKECCCCCCNKAVMPGNMYDTFTFDLDASASCDGFQALLEEKHVEEVSAFQKITTKGEKLRCLTIIHQRMDGRPVCLDFYVADDESFENISKMCAEIDMRVSYPEPKPMKAEPLNLITSVGYIADEAWKAMNSVTLNVFLWSSDDDDEMTDEEKKAGCCKDSCGKCLRCPGATCSCICSGVSCIGRCITSPCRALCCCL